MCIGGCSAARADASTTPAPRRILSPLSYGSMLLREHMSWVPQWSASRVLRFASVCRLKKTHCHRHCRAGNFIVTFTSLDVLRRFMAEPAPGHFTRREKGGAVAQVFCTPDHPLVLTWTKRSTLVRCTFTYDRKKYQ